MKTHLKNHQKICSKESVEVITLKKATDEQLRLILYYLDMFIITARLSFTILNSYFNLNNYFIHLKIDTLRCI